MAHAAYFILQARSKGSTMRRLPLFALLAASPLPAMAASLDQPPGESLIMTAPAPTPSDPGRVLGFTLRGGLATSPEYFGSDEYEIGPDLGFALDRLRFGPFDIGSDDPDFVSTGFGLRGSLRYISERDAEDVDGVTGLDDVDAALELGLGVGYDTRDFGVFADLRRGFGGHESFVAELGADVYSYPSERLTLRAGPRALFAEDDYAQTYFGAPGFAADGGLISAGVEIGGIYEFSDDWGLDGAITYDRLMNDAADSPITEDDDQFGARLGITRQIDFRF
ncbi:MipA/OmpV family protein [Limimaricola cinnabarinus]|uniref:MipA/OmpV family protein n=1 Tax=Limimaricola cinnabarinus TaxID=1125964 RepID=UPI0024908A31|nr:MipA/OmpV family protein [Limimaricola cinnabarinus]